MENDYKTAYKSVWLDKNTHSLVKEWADWRKYPFKKPLLLKRAVAVLIYCGGRYYVDHQQDGDLRFPDALQMKQRFDNPSPFDFRSRFRRLNYKLIWLDTDSYLTLKETASSLGLPMKHALPILIDWGLAYYSVKMLGSGAATKAEIKLQHLIFKKNFPKVLKNTLEMFPPFLEK